MKIKYGLLIILFFITLNVYAIEECTSEEMARLKELASNFEIKYTYEIGDTKEEDDELDTKYASYKLKVYNANENLRLTLVKMKQQEEKIQWSDVENKTYYEGTNLKYKLYSRTTNLCTDILLKTITVKIPYYNEFYERHQAECEENKDFKYCKEFIEEDIKQTEIEKEFKKYIQDSKKQSTSKFMYNLFNVLKDYIYIIVGVILIIVLVIVYIFKRKRRMGDL